MTAAADPCAACPRREVTENSRFGYCEGCTRRLRRCPACGRFRPQTDWGYGRVGLVFKLTRWCCSDCKAAQPRELPARLTIRLPVTEVRRATWVHELELSAARLADHPTVGPLMADLARQLGAGEVLDVDVSGLDELARHLVLVSLRNVSNRMPAGYADEFERLVRAWSWTMPPPQPAAAGSVPAPVAERVARLGWERPA